jgi:hypothetical protein
MAKIFYRLLVVLGLLLAPPPALSAPGDLAFNGSDLEGAPGTSEDDQGSKLSLEPAATRQASSTIVWNPGVVGAPAERVGGAVRGSSDLATPMVLVPNHLGLTASSAPSLFWHLDGATPEGVEIVFTLVDEEGETPLVETGLKPPPTRAGVQRVRLADYGIELEPGQPYTWSIALVPDMEDRARDRISLGLLQRTEISEKLPSDAEEFAAQGLWYDALEALSDAVDAEPENLNAQARRRSLLAQAGLTLGAD